MTTDSTRRPAHVLPAVAAAILLAVVAACSPTAGPTASPGATPSPTTLPTPTATAGFQHPTGAADVVLRLESGGGFVPIDFLATYAPMFPLYGDGRVVWREASWEVTDAMGNVHPLAPFRTVLLTESAVQSLLEDAIERGGLGEAAGPYMGQGADMPSTTFTLNVNGTTKVVSATPLSPDMQPQAGPIIIRLAALAQRLSTFSTIAGASEPFAPAAYRGILTPVDQALNPPVDWPWTTIAPEDFTSDGNTFLLKRTLTPDDVAALGLTGIEGGFSGLTLQQGTRLYSFSLRPLLPDETK